MTTVAANLAHATALLQRVSESPRADALLLLERTLARPRTWLIAHPQTTLPPAATMRFHSLCERRRAGIPIAYLTNSAGFCGLEFFVNESVLVPRPETEHIAEEAITWLQAREGTKPQTVLDIGTGSGAIACAIATKTQALVEAGDISAAALSVAARNAQRLNVMDRCRFRIGDLTDPVRGRRFDVIIANLPYIPTSDLPQAPNPIAHEPREALDGGPDGLIHYRRLLPNLKRLLRQSSLVLLEAAPPTIPALEELAQTHLPNFTIEIRNDYAALPRYLKAERT